MKRILFPILVLILATSACGQATPSPGGEAAAPTLPLATPSS